MPINEKIILALDVPNEAAALRLVEQLAGVVSFYKIGLELFTRCGPDIMGRVRSAAAAANQGRAGIFLDLKLYDIPNTVAGAVRAAAALNVDMLTVHLSGGGTMLRAACKEAGGGMLLLGVTVLTSSDQATLAETGVVATPKEQVMRLAQLGAENGIRGVVASPLEIEVLRGAFGRGLKIVVPGVRPAWAAGGDDQRRVMTPAQAVAAGADFLVIGRPISAHADPRAAAERIAEEIASAPGAALPEHEPLRV